MWLHMREMFFISDTHFGHKNIITFKKENGELIRSFDDLESMHELIIDRWNSIVGDNDIVVHCGDVAFGRPPFYNCMRRLNGNKILIKGNHDTLDMLDYAEFFNEIHGLRYFNGKEIACSHAPIHPESLRGFGVNVHGHMHYKKIDDPRYFNVSVEQIAYTPISIDEIRERIKG